MSDKFFETISPYVAGFLWQISGIKPLYRKKEQKIVFAFPSTDDIYRALQLFNENHAVPAAKYVDFIKAVRKDMVQAKADIKDRPE